MAGRANLILDNLIAEGKAVPMIVVMPYGHAVPFASPREAQARNTELFERYVLEDVRPLIESKYRVMAGRRNRALSRVYRWAADRRFRSASAISISSAWSELSAPRCLPIFGQRFAQPLEQANAKLKLLWIGCGRQDFIFERSKKLDELLKARGVRHTFRETEGRAHIHDLAPVPGRVRAAAVSLKRGGAHHRVDIRGAACRVPTAHPLLRM